MHEVLVDRLGGLSLPRKSVVRSSDRPDMTLDVYRGRKTTMQQQQQHYHQSFCINLESLSMALVRGTSMKITRARLPICVLIVVIVHVLVFEFIILLQLLYT